MKAGDIFRASEMSALAGAGAGGGEVAVPGGDFVSNVSGKNVKQRKKLSKAKAMSIGATGFIAGIALLAAFAVGGGNLMPVGILERLVEATDLQSANLTQDKFTIFGKSMKMCNVASDSATVLKNQGYIVGHMEGENFVEGGKDCDEAVLMEVEGTEPVADILQQVGYVTLNELVKYGYVYGDDNNGVQLADTTDTNTNKEIKYTVKIITGDGFRQKANTDVKLYNAMNLATFDRSGAYYDEEATAIFKSLGTSRHNFTNGSSFDEVMNKVNGKGSSVSVNSEGNKLQPDDSDGDGIIEWILKFFTGSGASSSSSAEEFVDQVRNDLWAPDADTAAKEVGNAITKVDQATQDQRGALLAATYMEPIDMIRADDGSQVSHDVMNRLFKQCNSSYLNEETGTMEETYGAVVESPTMYALLTDQTLATTEGFRNREVIQNTINNIVGNGGNNSRTTVVSADEGRKSASGRWVEQGLTAADKSVTDTVVDAVDASMMNNSYNDVGCIAEGEDVAAGMQSLQGMLSRVTGGTLGDNEAKMAYLRLNDEMLAMEAKADRLNRSPLDITSKNTFLGSIVYNFAIASIKNASLRNFAMGLGTVTSAVGSAISNLLPQSSADSIQNFLTDEGECEAINGINASAPKNCTEEPIFDVTTYDMLDDPAALQILDEYTTVNEDIGQREIKDIPGSPAVYMASYHVTRTSPSGSPDAAILEDLADEKLGILAEIPFISDILRGIQLMTGASPEELAIANGEEFVNSSSNGKWDTYKIIQRYFSMQRAVGILRQNSSDPTAYRNMKYFEGEENPVIAYLKKHYPDTALAMVDN